MIITDNQIFLNTIFGEYACTDIQPMVASVQDHKANFGWGGSPATSLIPFLENNNYYSCSSIAYQNGEFNRRLENFGALYVLMCDDIGTKAQEPELIPTYIIETSENNFQYGYVLKEPLYDSELANHLVKGLPNEYCDKGGKNAVRWARLPYGTNTKTSFTTRLAFFDMQYRYSIEELVAGLKIDLGGEAKPAKEKPTSEGSSGAPHFNENHSTLFSQLINTYAPFRKAGNGYNICCPAKTHSQAPNLSITQNAAGRILFHCQAGCSYQEVMTAFEARGFSFEAGEQEPTEQLDKTGSLLDNLRALAMNDELEAQLGEANIIWRDLLVEGHYVVLCAASGAGKSTLAMNICEGIASDYEVLYIQCDESGANIRNYYQHSKEHGYTLLTPDMHLGKSSKTVVDIFESLAASDESLEGKVFILDTMKKFVDLMSKTSAPKFNHTLRRMTLRGATIIALSHTNKYKDEDGLPIFDGVGDIKNDCDELIYLVPAKLEGGGTIISTKIDKQRCFGLKDCTFTIDGDRAVAFGDEYVDTASLNKVRKQEEKDMPVIEFIAQSVCYQSKTANELIVMAKEANNGIRERGIRSALKRWSKLPEGNPYFVEVGYRTSGPTYGNANRKVDGVQINIAKTGDF